MLENAKVTMDLKDFEELRTARDQERALKAMIAFAVSETDVEADGEEVSGVTLKVDLAVIERLVRKYHAFNKPKNEWIDETLDEEDIKVVFESKED